MNRTQRPAFPRRLLAASALFLGLVPPAQATWSIVVVNPRTGEVAVASATCLQSLDLQANLPVVVVGVGAGAAQALIDLGAINRTRMYNDLAAGLTPQQTLDDLIMNGLGNPNSRQYGIAGFAGPPVTFTGTGAIVGDAQVGVAGIVGDLQYAIQGNVLSDDSVVFAAETALINTPGDLGQKLVAAMEAARALGGDGRCSCSPSMPASCGPAPPGFAKSAHVAFVIVSRHGDTDPRCSASLGCARGDYYVELNIIGTAADIDPVFELQMEYALWRASVAGRPDHILSTVVQGADALPADGVTTTPVTVRLVDVEGVPLTAGGATITVTPDTAGSAATVGPVTDNGDGSYTFDVAGTTTPGSETFRIVADDGVVAATLFPFLEIEVEPVTPLHIGFDSVSATAGGGVPFVINEPAAPGAGYILLASASGTVPGLPFGGITLPLNFDPIFLASINDANSATLPNSFGTLDPGGRSQAAFVASPLLLVPFIGTRFDWAALLFGGGSLGVTNPVGFDIVL